MALSKHLMIGTLLVGLILLSIWFLIPFSNMIPKGLGFSTYVAPFDTQAGDLRKAEMIEPFAGNETEIAKKIGKIDGETDDQDSKDFKIEGDHTNFDSEQKPETHQVVKSNEEKFAKMQNDTVHNLTETGKTNCAFAMRREGENLKDAPVRGQDSEGADTQSSIGHNMGGMITFDWKLCKWKGAMDYIPCLDNKAAIRRLPSFRRFQHRERHCPSTNDFPMCIIPLPKGYKLPIKWPRSRDVIWLQNVPHTKLVSYKKDQNWVKQSGDKLIFPGGGTQFKHGASQYIDSIEEHVPDLAWGSHTRVVLDIGCGVASFGGYLFDRNVLTMSFAPKDEHEAQVQLALERGIPAFSAVMGTQRLPFSSNSFDLAHCARCRIHWHGDGGKWLMEVNRVLRPGGYFVWSATPVYRNRPEDMDFWKAMVTVTKSMCWDLTVKAKGLSSGVGFAVYQKPTSNLCYDQRAMNEPPICNENKNPDAAWYTPLENCMQRVPNDRNVHGAKWPLAWPERLNSTPAWLKGANKTLFGQSGDLEFQMDIEHWSRVFETSYLAGLGINWGDIRNVMDMKAGYGGFAAALLRTPAWVMNIVPVHEPDTLPIIFDRGLIGMYHDWCESFSTYPRTYDLLHANHLFEQLVLRCKPLYIVLEMDRILRPNGWVIIRDKSSVLDELRCVIESLYWDIQSTYNQGEEEVLIVRKTLWRPEETT